MTPTKFTDKIGGEIAALLQLAGQTKSRTYCATHVTFNGVTPTLSDTPCYAPTASQVTNLKHPDHFGIFYGGYSPHGISPGGSNWPVNLKSPEALFWLEHLLDDKGMFAPVLPFLWHTDPKEVLSDCGFVFKDVSKAYRNAGLLWTFIQATRLMFENPGRMEALVFARENYPKDIATLIALTLRPYKKGDPKGNWCPVSVAHGEPLGYSGWKRAGYILNRELCPAYAHATAGSATCYGGSIPLDYNNTVVSFPLDEWLSRFQKAAEEHGLVKA